MTKRRKDLEPLFEEALKQSSIKEDIPEVLTVYVAQVRQVSENDPLNVEVQFNIVHHATITTRQVHTALFNTVETLGTIQSDCWTSSGTLSPILALAPLVIDSGEVGRLHFFEVTLKGDRQ